ncbi:MAG: hypothetical protein ACXW4B_05525 [Micavibrio sp.]
MTTAFKKPDPAAVRAAVKESLGQAKSGADAVVETANTNFQAAQAAIAETGAARLKAVENDFVAAVESAKAPVVAQAQTVKELEAALVAARTELKTKTVESKQQIRTLKQTFNAAAQDVSQYVSNETKAAAEARAAALATARDNVAAAKAAGASEVKAERKALLDYRVFVVKDTTARVYNGTTAVAKILGTAFAAGYQQDTGVALPESVAKRQQGDKPQTPSVG